MKKSEEKILILSDDPLTAEAVELASSQLGIRSDFATDGWEITETSLGIHE